MSCRKHRGWIQLCGGLLVALLLAAPSFSADALEDETPSACKKTTSPGQFIQKCVPNIECELAIPSLELGVIYKWLGTVSAASHGDACCASSGAGFATNEGDCCAKQIDVASGAEVLPCPPISSVVPGEQHAEQHAEFLFVGNETSCPQTACAASCRVNASCDEAKCQQAKCGQAEFQQAKCTTKDVAETKTATTAKCQVKSKGGTALASTADVHYIQVVHSKQQACDVGQEPCVQQPSGLIRVCAEMARKCKDAVKSGATATNVLKTNPNAVQLVWTSKAKSTGCPCTKSGKAVAAADKAGHQVTEELVGAHVAVASMKVKLEAQEALHEQYKVAQQQLQQAISHGMQLEAKFEAAQREFEFNLALAEARAENAALHQQLALEHGQRQLLQQLADLKAENLRLKEQIAQREASDDHAVAKKDEAGEATR